MMDSFERKDSRLMLQESMPSMTIVPDVGSTSRNRAAPKEDFPARFEQGQAGSLLNELSPSFKSICQAKDANVRGPRNIFSGNLVQENLDCSFDSTPQHVECPKSLSAGLSFKSFTF